jgi:hypothetical protein
MCRHSMVIRSICKKVIASEPQRISALHHVFEAAFRNYQTTGRLLRLYSDCLLTSGMLWSSLSTVHAVSWLCLLLRAAVATIVEDSSPSIHYDSTWSIDGNGYNSGGSAHHTNISGGAATYSFTGEFGVPRRNLSRHYGRALLMPRLSAPCTAFIRHRGYPLWRGPRRWCKVLI